MRQTMTSQTRTSRTNLSQLSFRAMLALTLIMGVGSYLRVIDVWRPVDGSVTMRSTLWRETDVGSIAENFYREDNNILYPRTLWRENTPGYVESEFPLYPWLVAQTYRMFGYHEQLARLLSLLISFLTLLVLTRLSFFLFKEPGALVATAFFAVNPLLIYLSTAVQSDTLMFLFLSLALYYYLKSARKNPDSQNTREYFISIGFLSLAILCKATAATYALFFALDILRRHGLRKTLTDKATYLAMALLLIPNAVWVIHSHQFWLDYRMSLGVTNEGHLSGTDMLFKRKYYQGFLSNTTAFITSYPGLIAVFAGLWSVRKSPLAKPLYTLAISLGVFYFATLYTTGAIWAFYYHALSIPFVGILFGLFTQETEMRTGPQTRRRTLPVILGTGAIVGAAVGLALHLPLLNTLALGLITAAIAYALLAMFEHSTESGDTKRRQQRSFGREFVVILIAITLTAVAARSFRLTPQEHSFVTWSACAKRFATNVPVTSRIACWGSHSRSALDRIVAYNVPWMFFWMDRKGFSVPEDFQSVTTLDSVAQLGAEYYVEFLPGAARTPGFHQALRERYTMLDSCGAHVLYSLK